MGGEWNASDEETLAGEHAYAWGNRPQMGVAVVLGAQTVIFSYSQFVAAIHEGSRLDVYFYQTCVRLRGRHLQELASHIRRQCVSVIRLQHRRGGFGLTEDEAYIESITFAPAHLEELYKALGV